MSNLAATPAQLGGFLPHASSEARTSLVWESVGHRAYILSCLLLAGCEGTALVEDRSPGDPVPFDPCSIRFDVDRDAFIGPSACSAFVVEETIEVRGGATLTIEPGTDLRFDRGQGILVRDGRLVVGEADLEPVALGPSKPDAAADRWGGIIFSGGALPGSRITNTVVTGGGNAQEASGCVTVRSTAKDVVALEAVTLERCTGAGLWVDAEGVQLVGADIELAESEVGLSLAARNMKDVKLPLRYRGVAANVLRGGTVATSASWVRQDVPWRVEGDVSVGGREEPVLTLEAGVHLRFAPSTWLEVGDDLPGALVAEGSEEAPVILESDDSGTWHGVLFGNRTLPRAALDYTVVRRGGQPGEDVRGCVTIRSAGDLFITNSTFDQCEQSGISAVQDQRFSFGRLSGNAFKSSNVGLWLAAGWVGSVVEPQTFEDVPRNLIESGDITESTTWVKQSIPWEVRGNLTVQGPETPVLTLEPGVMLRFNSSSWLQIGSGGGGGLVAVGTAASPIVFESTNEEGEPGSWRGIVFGRNARAGGRLVDAVVRHGGQRELDVGGCITVRGGDDADRPITIERTTVEQCEQACVAATEGEFVFTSFTGNDLRDAPAGLHLSAAAAGSITTPQRYDGVRLNRIADSVLSRHASWSAQPVPWVVRGVVQVEGPSAPILTINAGTEVRFDDGAMLAAGLEAPGGLVVGGSAPAPVIFTSAQSVPAPGNWHGIFLGPMVEEGTRLDFLDLSYAGQPGGGVQGGVTLDRTGARVRIASSTFHDNMQADVHVDCDSQPLLSANTFTVEGLVFETCQ